MNNTSDHHTISQLNDFLTIQMREKIVSLFDRFFVAGLCKAVLISGIVLYMAAIFIFKNPSCSPVEELLSLSSSPSFPALNPLGKNITGSSPTNISHLLFGLLGSEKAWHYRKAYVEAWWRPGETRGFLYLDVAPKGGLMPWSTASPPYRVSDDISAMIRETKHVAPVMARMVHGIMEVFRERSPPQQEVRWVVMGDDDSVFFVDNMVDVLAAYDHTKYYYFGGQSEFVKSNYWFSFNQGFGGAGFILSYPLAAALSEGMESCLRRYARVRSADTITMLCISDLGVNLTPLKGFHQVDLHGDLSGFLSSHPKDPLLSLHHLDMVEPIFPSMGRFDSARHLLKSAAKYDQTRMLQQTICYHRNASWTISVSWGYSVHIYEKVHPRSYLQMPIETFKPWVAKGNMDHPLYMFNTRRPSDDPCESPHVFFLKTANQTAEDGIVMTYLRSSARGLPACSLNSVTGNNSADYVFRIEVYSPLTKRPQMDICECCDIMHPHGGSTLKVKYRQCVKNGIIA
ncbi:unnamed protein product [Cuscuta europaea]|uniref:Uncharacterized protein n=1 Tax=Cuscuta europaea TaxID=41803 RepID=A0A9P1E1Y6_CUSEU|nr:unnamed protein product [Cuscuta europaea]